MPRIGKEHARSSRQRPVSCHFCRSRKLRCSRQFPCSNCTSRGVACRMYASTPSPANSAQDVSDQSSPSFNADVLARLRRLEEIVIGRGRSASTPTEQPPPHSLPPKGENTYRSRQEHSSVANVNWLEGEITYPGSTDSLLAHEIEFRPCPIRQATTPAPLIYQDSSQKCSAIKCIWLPLHEESKKIVDKYLNDVTYIHHVVHTPSMRTLVDDIYEGLNENKNIKLGHIALLLAFLASTTFFCTERDMDMALFSSVEEANGQSASWMKAALEVLEHSRRTRSDSLEDVQAMIIVSFVASNMVGVTSLTRHLFGTAISTARELSLHRIDHPHNTGLVDVPSPDSVRAEIGRRVWWYLVSTDWQLSQYAGPQRGTYTINPRHMVTNKPRNADDEDLVDGMVGVGQPMDQPTSMSYYLQRIRLGELCREISDSFPFSTSISGSSNYQQVQEVDTKLREFVTGMPPFFSSDCNADELSERDQRIPREIITHRYIIQSLVHTHICRLHLPYLSRASTEPTYASSREACLEAARMVIRSERQRATSERKLSGVMHCVCTAIIAFLADFCVRKSSRPDEVRGRREEIFDALDLLEEAKGQSATAAKLLKAFDAVLRRHGVLSGGDGNTAARPGDTKHPSSFGLANSSPALISADPTGMSADYSSLDPTRPSFDQLWQTFDANTDLTAVDWNALFGELDCPFFSV